MPLGGELSSDGTLYWDGQRWITSTSPDGLWRWDGARWAPVGTSALTTQQSGSPLAVQPYTQQPYPAQYASPVLMYKSPTNSAAVVSLIFGIVSWFLCPLIGGIVAVITGHMAHSQIKRSGEGGAGLATSGMVLGYIHLAAAAVFIVFWLFVFGGLAALFGAIATTPSATP
jgi:hypothetical protein